MEARPASRVQLEKDEGNVQDPIQTPKVEYLTGWRVTVVDIANF